MKKLILLFILCISPLNSFGQKIYINSIPKAGTYLLFTCINLLTGRKIKNLSEDLVTLDRLPPQNSDTIFCWHVKFSKKAFQVFKNNNFRGVFIYRDPRDRIVSSAFAILKDKNLLEHYGYKNRREGIFSDLITKLIPINNDQFRSYLPWLKIPLFYSLKFEDLVGTRGGGDNARQLNTLRNICAHLGIKYNRDKIIFCSKHIFGRPGKDTFRSGKIGSWRKYFTQEHKKLFKKMSGDLLINLGYEKDYNW